MNRIYHDDPDRVSQARAARLASGTGDMARVAELGRQLARVLDPETPGRARELARIGREAAQLPPRLLERLLASVPGAEPEQVREALRSFLRPAGTTRPAATDSLEQAADRGPFAGHAASVTVTAVEPEAVAVSPLDAEDLSRSRAWRGDRAFGVTSATDASTPTPEARSGSPAAVPAAPAPTVAAAAPANPTGPASEPGPAASVYEGEPPVAASWLQEREAALVAIRADYEAARARALAVPGEGPGWQTAITVSDESGQLSSAAGRPLVWVADPSGAQEVVGWDEGGPQYRAVGRHVEFDEEAFAAHYRGLAGEPLQRLAAVYDPTGGKDAAALLAAHPELWSIAISDHALNAGPPLEGFVMGDAGQLGMLDLYLADPQIAALIEAHGGDPALAASGIAAEQVRLFGERRFEQMSRLANAMASVRGQYANALGQAEQAGNGPGWVDRERTGLVGVDVGDGSTTAVAPLYARDDFGNIVYDAAGQPVVMRERVFDVDAFTDWYLAQDGAEHQVFASLYGRSHTQSVAAGEGESGQISTSRFSNTSFDNPNWSLSGSGGAYAMSHVGLLSIDPNHPPRLRDDRVVGFDLEAGWATPHANIYERRDWLGTVVQVALVAAITYYTGGAASGWATSAAAGAGASAATATAVGAVAGAAAAGAAGSVVSGMMSGNLTLRSVVQGALAGALTAGVMNSALAEAVHGAAGAAGTLALQTTVKGAVQALLDGSFREGARAALASGLADLVGADINRSINTAVAAGTMSASEAIAARTFARMFGSAIRTAGNPGDPGYAFATDFLSETVRSVLPPLPAPVPTVTQTVLDDDGNLRPGVVNTAAPPALQALQLAEQLQRQGLSGDEAAAVAQRTIGQDLQRRAVPPAPDSTSSPSPVIPEGDPSPPAFVWEVVGRALPQDAFGNRYETDAQGRQVVYLAGGGMLALDAAAVGASVGGRVVLGLAALQRVAAAVESVATAVASFATSGAAGLLLVAVPGNAMQGNEVVELSDSQRFERRPGELYGSLYERDSNGSWQAVSGRHVGYRTDAGFVVLDEEQLARQSRPITTPIEPPQPSGAPPLPAWADQPDPLPGTVAEPTPGPTLTTTPGDPLQDFRDLLISQTGRVTVLGHNPEYLRVADEMGARRLAENWEGLTDDEKWARNARFLDETIRLGHDIVLTTPASEARWDTFFERELEYLAGRGYTVSPDGRRMLPPTAGTGETPGRVISDSDTRSYRELLAEQLGIPADDLVNTAGRGDNRAAAGAGFQPLPAAPQTTIYDDGSRLIDLGNGRSTAIPAVEYHREFAIANFAARTGQSSDSAGAQVSGLSERLGPGGDTILAQALATGRMTVGMLGITPRGIARDAATLQANRGDMSTILGRGVDAMLDNTNHLLNAFVAAPNSPQASRLNWLLEFNRDAGITTDIAVHSNGVNALASSLRLVPDARLGEVRLIDVNVSGDDQRAVEDLRRIVQASTRTELVASALDFALSASRAGDPTATLIRAAAAAGVQYIRVLEGSFHNLDAVASALAQQSERGRFDFERNASGQMVPVNEAAWRQAGYTWSNGRLSYDPRPAGGANQRRGTLPRPSGPPRSGRSEA